MLIYLNGRLVKKEAARVSVFDHGLLYGDGVFEGIRSYKCIVFKLNEHIDRLYASAHAIALEIPMSKSRMREAVLKTLKANRLKDAYIRLVVTRGEGDLGLDPRTCRKPTIFIIADKIALYPPALCKQGMTLVTVSTRRNISEALSPRIKSLNYLNNILGKIEALNAGVPEAVMLDQNGFVTECTGVNIFMVQGSRLLTPAVSIGILAGVTRSVVLGLAARADLEPCETALTRFDLFGADEVFLTGTAAEIIPVVKIDGRVIGAGVAGQKTLMLLTHFRKTTKEDGVRYAV